MSNTKQPASQPTADKRGRQASATPIKPSNPKRDFYIAAGTMSWQLAVVVLVPIIGGFKLDEYTNSLPLWTIVGFILAMIGMAVVVWRQMQQLAPSPTTTTGPTSHNKGASK